MSRREAWTEQETKLLRELWLERDLMSLSEALGRTVCAIEQFARSLGLPKRPRANAVPQERIDFIRDNVGKMTVIEMAEVIRCPPVTVYKIARNNGISFRAP